MSDQHPLEDADSWSSHLERNQGQRRLKHHHHHNKDAALQLEQEEEEAFWARAAHDEAQAQKLRDKQDKKRLKRMHELWRNPDISVETVHGLMIDAGSTGSRMHVYEWEPRVLSNQADIEAAVSGNKLSFPGTESRWTDRLQPGLSSFADIQDDQKLQNAVAEYLQPLLDFAKAVLSTKQAQLGDYPIFLRATAGMRILNPPNRARVMKTVRDLFHNKTYCPFSFVNEQARVISGEEEAIYDWTGVNFLLGDLIDDSQGAGTVVEPRLTHGALDLGGASTQIGFYEPHEDIMASLFKLQIGQAKHWNLYAHSFVFYGVNEAINRFHARLAAGKTSQERMVDGIYNPCFAAGVQTLVRTDIHINDHGVETWEYKQEYPSGNGFYQAVLKNDKERGDATKCLELAKDLLHLEKNDWCNFAHKGDCSLAGIYQPDLPMQTPNFGEFVAFSNYYHIWRFLHLPERATIAQLKNATEYACSMSRDELVSFNDGAIEEEELDSYCFRSAYAFQLLHNGYGFQMNVTIRATRVIHGQKVGWALGAMLYEINAMPWKYVKPGSIVDVNFSSSNSSWHSIALMAILVGMIVALLVVFIQRKRNLKRYREKYELVKEAVEIPRKF